MSKYFKGVKVPKFDGLKVKVRDFEPTPRKAILREGNVKGYKGVYGYDKATETSAPKPSIINKILKKSVVPRRAAEPKKSISPLKSTLSTQSKPDYSIPKYLKNTEYGVPKYLEKPQEVPKYLERPQEITDGLPKFKSREDLGLPYKVPKLLQRPQEITKGLPDFRSREDLGVYRNPVPKKMGSGYRMSGRSEQRRSDPTGIEKDIPSALLIGLGGALGGGALLKGKNILSKILRNQADKVRTSIPKRSEPLKRYSAPKPNMKTPKSNRNLSKDTRYDLKKQYKSENPMGKYDGEIVRTPEKVLNKYSLKRSMKEGMNKSSTGGSKVMGRVKEDPIKSLLRSYRSKKRR